MTRTYTVPPRSRFNIWTDQERDASGALLLPGTAFSVRLDSTCRSWPSAPCTGARPRQPIRPRRRFPGRRATSSPASRNRWRSGPLPKGGRATTARAERYDSFFLVVNPSAVDIDVRATFATEDGTGVTTTVKVLANTRANIWPARGPHAGLRSAAGPTLRGVPRERRRAALRRRAGDVLERVPRWACQCRHAMERHVQHAGASARRRAGDEHDADVGAAHRRDRRDHSRAELRPDAGGAVRRTDRARDGQRGPDRVVMDGAGAQRRRRATARRARPR